MANQEKFTIPSIGFGIMFKRDLVLLTVKKYDQYAKKALKEVVKYYKEFMVEPLPKKHEIVFCMGGSN